MGRCRTEIPGRLRASNRRKSGVSGSACKARRMANRVASRILRRSISASLADPMPMPLARRTISANSRIRSGSPTCLESFNPASRQRRGNTTAAATTGPARGPRPASSRPAMRRYPQHLASTSNSSVGPPVVGFEVPAKRAPLRCCQMEMSTDQAFAAEAVSAAASLAATWALLSTLNSRSSTLANLPFFVRK